MHRTYTENEMQTVFEYGHQKVLKSLIQFTNKPFAINTLKAKSIDKSEIISELGDIPFDTELTLFKTEIIGDVFGKSYWLIDESARNYITSTDNHRQVDNTFTHEMLREVDNIISATLISQLSDHFSLEIYGDVPELLLPKLQPLTEIIASDFKKANQSLFVYVAEFPIKEVTGATCLFMWYVEEKMFLQEQK